MILKYKSCDLFFSYNKYSMLSNLNGLLKNFIIDCIRIEMCFNCNNKIRLLFLCLCYLNLVVRDFVKCDN